MIIIRKFNMLAVMLLFLATSLPAFSEPDVKTLADLPENEIDIGISALVLAKEVFPEIDIHAYSAKIDTIVFAVKELTGGEQTLITECGR